MSTGRSPKGHCLHLNGVGIDEEGRGRAGGRIAEWRDYADNQPLRKIDRRRDAVTTSSAIVGNMGR